MQQVPTYIYLIAFIIFEGFAVLTAFLSYKISKTIRKKELADLHK
jgi:ABC-type proline/glycine betaine transport system permease subunit